MSLINYPGEGSTWHLDSASAVDILGQDMITLHRQLNAVQLFITSIQSLPNELLSSIFRSACTVIKQPPPHTPIKPGLLLLIPPPMSKFSQTSKFSTSMATLLSLVCRRWRLVILFDLALWSDIDVSRPRLSGTSHDALKWAVDCAIRSYPLPMSISASNYSGNPLVMMHLAHFINNNGQRIRELKAYLRITGGFVNDFKYLQSPMPTLEVLEIGCSPRWETIPGIALPKLFSHDYPRLKHVSIQHFTAIPPRAFTNLVTLVLSYSNGRVMIDNFLALIAGSPSLEVLWFKRYLVTQSVNSRPPVPVSLPRLSSITLENCDSHLILSALKIPNTATLRIMYAMHYLRQRPRNALTDAFPLDPTIIGSLNSVRTLSYGVNETTAVLFLKDSQGNKLVHVEQGHSIPDTGLLPFARQYVAFLRTCFHDLFALEQAADLLGSLTTLELDLRGLSNRDTGGSRLSFWLAFFESTPRLEVLHASYSYVPAMLDGLNPSNNAARKLLCPSLRTLQLDIRTGAFDLKNDWLVQVIDAARWRGKCRSPFRDVFVYLLSNGYGHEFMLPSDAVRAMFSLRDSGVENMVFSNGISTYTFDKDNFVLPELPRPFWENWAATAAHETTRPS
ncbi:hypothetical protein BDM02DRAFT_1866257 [Thelephora ganbajun]|uniref:Uncharacterized protein n=1 Tax=Thelephora ganbajun TaxID=370292 RepID=A0ACB6ZIN9_THEGA|nr:hypothetical protein BDM02DRAFT_1866257 [Thelephora ganbajun]